MKPAILVTSHPNTSEKDLILTNFGKFLSQYNLDTYLFTNYPSSQNSQKEFTGVYYTSYNPPGNFNGVVWYTFKDLDLIHYTIIPNWCYSFMNLIINGAKILKSLGYTHFIYLIYDTETNDIKVKNYIDYSLKTLQHVDGVFNEYEAGWENSLSTSNCACEINFFINIFESSLKDYQLGIYNSLAEKYWYQVITNYLDQVDISLPKNQILTTSYGSVGSYYFFNSGTYWMGYNKAQNKILIVSSFDYLELHNSKNESIKLEHIGDTYCPVKLNNLKIYEVENQENEDYYHKDYLLFKNTNDWKNSNFWK